MRAHIFISIILTWLLQAGTSFAQTDSTEKIVSLKCKGKLHISYQVDERKERTTQEELFTSEVRYKDEEPHSILVVGLSGTSLLPCKATDSSIFCESKREVVTAYGDPTFKGMIADLSAKYSLSTKVTLNRITGLMKYQHLSTVEKSEPQRGTSRHEVEGLVECQVGSKPLL